MVILYNVASYRFWEGLYLFGWRVPPSQEKKRQKSKHTKRRPSDIFGKQLILTQIEKKTFYVSLEASIGVATSPFIEVKRMIVCLPVCTKYGSPFHIGFS